MVAITICRRDGGEGGEGKQGSPLRSSYRFVEGILRVRWLKLRPGFYLGSRPLAEFHAIQSKSGNMAADLRLERSRFLGS